MPAITRSIVTPAFDPFLSLLFSPLLSSPPGACKNSTEREGGREREGESKKMGRSPRCDKDGLNKGAWTAAEDKILMDYVKLHGEGKWSRLSRETGKTHRNVSPYFLTIHAREPHAQFTSGFV